MDFDWQNGLKTIKERGLYILQTNKLSDCRFSVGTYPNNRLIRAHKLILAIASPVFEKMFYGSLTESKDPIPLADVDPNAFQLMLTYIYTDQCKLPSYKMACDLCYVAKKYMIIPLQDECSTYMWALLSPSTACRAYEYAKLFDDPLLLQAAIEIIQSNTSDILKETTFMDIEYSTLMDIFEMNSLNIESEIELFKALERYALHNGMLNEKSATKLNTSCCRPSGGKSFESKSCTSLTLSRKRSCSRPLSSLATSAAITAIETATDSAPSMPRVKSKPKRFEKYRHKKVSESDMLHDETNMIMIREALKRIRFLAMPPQEFGKGPGRSKLLQQHEAFAIINNIYQPSCSYSQMPKGFCTLRETRNAKQTKECQPRCHPVKPSLKLSRHLSLSPNPNQLPSVRLRPTLRISSMCRTNGQHVRLLSGGTKLQLKQTLNVASNNNADSKSSVNSEADSVKSDYLDNRKNDVSKKPFPFLNATQPTYIKKDVS